MKAKIICILVMTLLIVTSLPAFGQLSDFTKEEINVNTTKTNSLLGDSENGMIICQDLNEDGQGYTVMRLWGSYYEMGFAHAELLGDYIVQGFEETKDLLGGNYNSIKTVVSSSIWMPSDIEDEFDGMVDSLTITHPSSGIDKNDLKVVNTIGDWSYSFACRSHTCWGRYVAEPIKTLSTRRLDFQTPFSIANHHLLCVYYPDDGSTKWINLAWPGYVVVSTGVNEFGTISSVHDWVPMDSPDLTNNRMPRVVASRYALTYPTDPDLSTHLSSVYSELQNYEIMSMIFLNYYVPEGYGGVMTCDPFQSGSDFYDLRLPQMVWHHGEAMITTNKFTDGTYTPPDEDFGADTYYNDETPKTLDSHWDILDSTGGNKNMHILSIAYRDREDITVWAEGRLDGNGRTERLEFEWEDLFEAEPPLVPNIDGPTSGKPEISYEYVFNAVDPDGDDVKYHIDWGDGETETTEFNPSGTDVKVKYTWNEQGDYLIKVTAEDTDGFIGPEGTHSISIPRNKMLVNSLILRVFGQFPLLKQLLGL